MSTRLELLAATVRFGDVAALDAVDLAVDGAEVMAILGPSGSGKSTLLRSVAGLQPLSAGTVELDGVDVSRVPPHRRGVGLMFQDRALFPHLDAAANIAFGLRMRRQPAAQIEARVAELLEVVGLPGAGSRSVHTLSGGEQQRVALARSLAPEPEVLLLDEPLGALDRPLRERLVVELRELFERLDVTVVSVTHDHAEAFALADRLAVMDRGRVLQVGSPAEVWGRPASARVASLLGFANVAPASVVDGRLRTPWGDLATSACRAGAVVVRPEGVRLDPAGDLTATVRSSVFHGARTRLRLSLAGAPDLDADVVCDVAPAAGEVVRLSIDPTGATALTG